MDSSKHYFSAEGCSSSESGWTKYMDSPTQEDEAECSNVDDADADADADDDDDDNNDHISNKNDDINDDDGDDKEESDDSMASDASSGPSDRHKRANNDKAHRGMASSKQSKLEHVKKLFSWKKTNEKEKHKKFGK